MNRTNIDLYVIKIERSDLEWKVKPCFLRLVWLGFCGKKRKKRTIHAKGREPKGWNHGRKRMSENEELRAKQNKINRKAKSKSLKTKVGIKQREYFQKSMVCSVSVTNSPIFFVSSSLLWKTSISSLETQTLPHHVSLLLSPSAPIRLKLPKPLTELRPCKDERVIFPQKWFGSV